jgi:hypothetical protein
MEQPYIDISPKKSDEFDTEQKKFSKIQKTILVIIWAANVKQQNWKASSL